MFAIPDDGYPGGWFYRFQYYHPEEREILRFDNTHDDDNLGWNHQHVRFGEDNEITFQSITVHIAHFLQEVAHLTHTEDTNND
jgi:hypothetical protein